MARHADAERLARISHEKIKKRRKRKTSATRIS
ncbi:hypothetical protein CCP2SC5_30023 [Azospirillaceae bacterium]